MCGRVVYGSSTEMAEKLGVKPSDTEHPGDNNAFPYKGTYLLGILDKEPDKLVHLHWPLIPYFANEYPKYNTSNARSETMHESSSFKNLLGKRHCIVVVDGFYEWERTGEKRPFYFSMADGRPMKYAGLYDINTRLGAPILSTAIITRSPNEIIGEVHDRMPVILTDDQVKIWLDMSLPYEERAKILVPIENSYLLKREVRKTVNKASNKSGDWFTNDDEQCLF